jgi:hypothetical protein
MSRSKVHCKIAYKPGTWQSFAKPLTRVVTIAVVQNAVGESSVLCKLPAHVIVSSEKYMHELEAKVQAVKPVVAKGRVSIDFDNCLVGIAASIAFCARKPPNTSAEFESREAAMEIIADLAIVIMAFGTPVVIEGHTGQVDPVEYWGTLAANRASLICNELTRCGVPPGLVRAKGCPGGGAKVLILPDKAKSA